MKLDENKFPKIVNNHKNQIMETIKLLKDNGLTEITINPIFEYDKYKRISTINWNNMNLSEGVNSSTFTSLKDYLAVYNNKTFQIMLFDYSLIRCSMEFEDELLLRQNFSWIPCPVSLIKKDEFGESIVREQDEMEMIFRDGLALFEDMNLRTPIRVDFDFNNDNSNHPKSHIHLQNPFTRVNSVEPICFNTFIKFVLSTCYPKEYIQKKITPILPKVDLSIKDENLKGLNISYGSKKRVNYNDNLKVNFGNVLY